MLEGWAINPLQKLRRFWPVKIRARCKHLDVGCGTGLLAEHLRALGFANIDGLDFSADMLAEAQRLKRINNAYYRDLNQPLPPPRPAI